MALAARRRAKGSLEPVGSMPSANMLAMVSMRSARPRMQPSALRGMVSLGRGGQVLVVDGVGDGGGQALRRGVEAADDALQLGELLDELGGEVGLGEDRGFVDGDCVESCAAEGGDTGEGRCNGHATRSDFLA